MIDSASPLASPPAKRRKPFDWAFAIVLMLSGGAVASVAWQEGWPAVRDILTEDLWMFAEILPKVLAGTAIGACVRLLVPARTIRRWLGTESGWRGLFIATLAGALFPGGPFTVFPLAGAFLLAGADRGAAIAFVTSWLLIGLNRMIVWEMPFFGADFVLLRAVLSLPLPLLAGFLARHVWKRLTGQGARS